MGIDIYLNGYEGHKVRTKALREAFDAAVKDRDGLPDGSPQRVAAQEKVEAAYGEMNSGRMGYLRSSYNSSGLFRVLEEIYGFDMGAYLFPGSWDRNRQINGEKFVAKVALLEKVAQAALQRGRLELPWIEIFSEISKERAPDPHEQHVHAEGYGDLVAGLIGRLGVTNDAETHKSTPVLMADHVWYLTTGLKELREFGELAVQLNSAGHETFVTISY
jgi:hypothetical protein